MFRLLPLALLVLASGASGQTLPDGGGSLTPEGPDGPSLDTRERIAADVEAARAALRADGKGTAFDWPLRDREAAPIEPIGISNYVDLDPSSGLQDWSCGERTYNGHDGTDIFLWPFSWALMDANRVEAVAAAPGTIVFKQDGHGDRQCTWTDAPPGNGIVILHDDGSEALYWHFRTNSMTTKAVGETVTAGEFLGLIGSSGTSTGPHLHFEVKDGDGNIVDPYEGTCNGGGTWWMNQRPYLDPTLLDIRTHRAAPQTASCPGTTDSPNYETQFEASDVVRFAAYYRDLAIGMVTRHRVLRPDGTTWDSWSHSNTTEFPGSYWWFSRTLPFNAPDGQWTYEVEFEGQTLTHAFQVGKPATSTEPLANGTSVTDPWPNPASGATSIRVTTPEAGRLAVVVLDMLGRTVATVTDEPRGAGEHTIALTGLAPGAYVVRVASGDEVTTRRLTVAK